MFLAGCTNLKYTVVTPTETRSVDLNRIGYDTKIGKLSVQTQDGVKVDLENMDSQEKATNVLNKLIDKIPNATVVP